MGASESKEIAKQVASHADQGRGLEDIFNNEQLLPEEWKDQVGRLGLHFRSDRYANALSKITKISESDLIIPSELQLRDTSWKEEPSTFFADLMSESGKITSEIVYAAVNKLKDLTDTEEIQQRILAVALHELYSIRDFVISEFVEELPHLNREKVGKVEKVEKQIRQFISFGQKLSNLCKGTGGYGTLLVVPTRQLTWLQWAKDISHKQTGEAVRHLRSINVSGISRDANGNQVVDSLINWIKLSIKNRNIEDEGGDIEDEDDDIEYEDRNLEDGNENMEGSEAGGLSLPKVSTIHKDFDPMHNFPAFRDRFINRPK
ncbi:MAG: hypothetical protein M1814_006668 [Vezdaea aestivalis]|nr:MAG: hypothetical protein M1814_006668 [Vezdaea aestivalis]